MSKYKTVKSIAVIALCFGIPSVAAAQSATSNATVNQATSIETSKLVKPVATTTRSRTKRIVKAVPVQAGKTNMSVGKVYGRKIEANNATHTEPTRFVFKSETKNSPIPVYFSAESLNSK